MKNFETFTVMNVNNRVAHINLEGLTHEDSLIVPPTGGNNINWILGHIIVSRDDINEILGLEKRCDEKLLEVYSRGTKTVAKENAFELSELLKMLDDSQKPLVEKLVETDFSEREADLKTVAFLAFHEAYHMGQLGLLRRIAGKSGAIA